MTNEANIINRRKALKGLSFLAGSTAISTSVYSKSSNINNDQEKVLRIAHITDVHIRPELDAPKRFLKCLNDIKDYNVDFFLNGGDTIYAADYDHITRERVLEQWEIWKGLRREFSGYEVHSCLGNHDMWWAAPNKQDPMYGKDYVVKQLGTPGRFYSFDKKGWHFIILDSNNNNAGSLDMKQRQWLESDLSNLPKDSNVLIMSHYPILGANGGKHTDHDYLTSLFYKQRDKRITCLSGHVHILDRVVYNHVQYFCNGALSGFWWEEGNEQSAGKYWVRQTPPGYAIIDLYEDGSVSNTYYSHPY